MESGAEGLVRHRALGGMSVYRVVNRSDELVELEVVSAPGLATGRHVRVTASTARAMGALTTQTRRRRRIRDAAARRGWRGGQAAPR